MGKRSTIHSKIPKELPVFLFFVVLCSALALSTNTFAKPGNLRALGFDAAAIGIMAVGMTAVIITGGIDLSVASILALSAVVGGKIIAQGNIPLGCIAALGTGLACGLLNGLLISKAKLPPIIATLGALYVFQSAATLYSGGQCIMLEKNQLAFLGNGFAPLVLTLLIFAVGGIVMSHTKPGRNIYAIGGNEEAARLAGINPNRTKMMAYIISGFLAALAGLVMMGIGSTFQAHDAVGYELAVIAAVVIGGTSIMGGEGSIFGTLIGLGISVVLKNGALLIGLDERWSLAVIGAAIFLATVVDRLRRR